MVCDPAFPGQIFQIQADNKKEEVLSQAKAFTLAFAVKIFDAVDESPGFRFAGANKFLAPLRLKLAVIFRIVKGGLQPERESTCVLGFSAAFHLPGQGENRVGRPAPGDFANHAFAKFAVAFKPSPQQRERGADTWNFRSVHAQTAVREDITAV